ncbi:acyltransferase family protein [Aeromonas veronii]
MWLVSKTPLGKNRNNFNLMRLLFASLVIVSHSYSFLGFAEPTIFGRSFGNFAVHCFFVLSGYLIAASWLNQNNSAIKYFENRVLRIVPGLVVALVICHYISIYFNNFVGNPIPYIVNGPVWTLTWEITCYVMVALLGMFYVLNKNSFPAVIVCTLFLYAYNYGSNTEFYMVILPFFICFMFGSFIYVMKDVIDLHKAIIPASIVLLLCFNNDVFNYLIDVIKSNVLFLYGVSIDNGFVRQFMYMLSIPFFLIYIGLYVDLRINVKTDISYGVYIYGWPASQIIVFYAIKYSFSLTPTILTLLTFLVTGPVAYISWRLVEGPCLKLKGISFFLDKAYVKGG